jgi:hypothetical protein
MELYETYTKVEDHFYNTDHIPSDAVGFLGTRGIFVVSYQFI